MAKQMQITVEFTEDGKAIIRIPHGKTQQLNAAELKQITEALGESLGTIEERHIGDHDHHHHGTNDATTHNHTNA